MLTVVRTLMIALCAVAGVFWIELALIGHFRFSSIRDAYDHIQEMRRPPHVVDSMTVLFRQNNDIACGAFALAYALTLMGDSIFGEQLYALDPPKSPSGYSMFELAKIASNRGFTAEGFAGNISNLPQDSQAPVIAHLTIGHFVVVLYADPNTVTFFDPSTGNVHVAPSREFAQLWSGKYLEIGMRDYHSLEDE